MNSTHTSSVVRLAALLFVVGSMITPAAAQYDNTTRTVTKRGTTAADFLNIPIGARATSMGNAITASISGPASMYWNPAGLATMREGAFLADYATWLAEIDVSFVAVAVPTAVGTVGIGLTSMVTPDMEVTTVDQQDGTGERFNASSYALALSYARPLTDRFAIGGSVKVIGERIWHSTSSGVAFDIGTQFVTPFKDVRLGASITNFGSKLQIGGDDLLVVVDIDPNAEGNNESNRARFNTDRFDLPLTMRIGLAGEAIQTDDIRLTIGVDALNPNNSEQFVNVGAELGLRGDLIMLRAGMSELFLQDSIRSYALGAGLRYRFAPLIFSLDYSYEVQDFFADVNRFTLTVGF